MLFSGMEAVWLFRDLVDFLAEVHGHGRTLDLSQWAGFSVEGQPKGGAAY